VVYTGVEATGAGGLVVVTGQPEEERVWRWGMAYLIFLGGNFKR